MTSREDFGRLAYAAHCDMAGRPIAWGSLDGRERAAWMHAAVAVRDRLALGIAHAYRPDEIEESTMALAKSTMHGGSEEPTINETDDADLYTREKAHGNKDVRWGGEGPAPDEVVETEPEPEEVEQPEEAPRPSRTARGKR